MLLDNLRLFLMIVEKGGMATAGREFGLSPARVSERLSNLERHYGVSLLNRTTRSISLTEEGHELAKSAKNILSEVDDLQARIKLGHEQISGMIHISATIDFGRSKVAPILDSFMKEHPDIDINLTLTDGNVDLVADGIDLAFRFGNLEDSSLHYKRLGENKRLVCASPAYIKKHGMPKHPFDLVEHNCLLVTFGNYIDRHWRFMVDGQAKRVSVKGKRIANNGELIADWCRAGHGIAFKSEWDVREDIKAGNLVEVLKEFRMPPATFQIVYPENAIKTRRIKLLVDYIVKAFA